MAAETDVGVVPAKERDEVAISVKRGELPGAEIGRSHAGTRDVVENTRGLQLGEEAVDVCDLDPATCCASEEGLSPRTDRPSVEVLAGPPIDRKSTRLNSSHQII